MAFVLAQKALEERHAHHAPDRRANRTSLEVIGAQREEVIGRPFWDTPWWAGVPGLRAQIQAAIAEAASGKVHRSEVQLRTLDGQPMTLDFSIRPVFGGDGRVTRLVPEGHDVTSRREAERKSRELQAQLIHAQKMEAVDQLAGGIAHDFNNILAAILLNAGLLQSEADDREFVTSTASEIHTAATRAATLTRQLLAFGRRQVVNRRRLELGMLLQELMRMLRRLIGEDIALELHAAEPAWVDADPGMLEQVVMNLAVNARDALPPHGGRITITAATATVPEGGRHTNPDARPGTFVCLTVTDTGSGMDGETLAHIFEPFFTTKELGKGTGLGLATVYGIVQQHDGWLDVESAPGQGSSFRVYLPPCEAPSEVAAQSAHARPRGGSECLLVVEDERSVRSLAFTVLSRAGYRVLAAADVQEALGIWNREKDAIDLVLSDLVMPGGMSGLELAELVRRESPRTRVMITSGYSLELSQKGLPADASIAFLPKPFDHHGLAQAVRRCLDSP